MPKKDPKKVAAAYKGIIGQTVVSPKNKMLPEDYKRWAQNTAKFFAPAALIFLISLKSGSTLAESLDVLYLWGLNVVIDFLTKWTGEGSYKTE